MLNAIRFCHTFSPVHYGYYTMIKSVYVQFFSPSLNWQLSDCEVIMVTTTPSCSLPKVENDLN